MVASLRPYSWAKYWSRMGHDVTVLTARHPAAEDDLSLDLTGFKIRLMDFPGIVKGIRDKLKKKGQKGSQTQPSGSIAGKKGLLDRLREKYGIFQTIRMPDHSDLLYFRGVNAVKDGKWDVVVSTYGPYLNHLIAKKLKKQGRTKLWCADYRDLWTQNSYYGGMPLVRNIEEGFEKRVNGTADLLTTVSKELAEDLKYKYLKDQVYTISNAVDPDDFMADGETSSYLDQTKITIVYTGSINPRTRNPELLFQAVSDIQVQNKSLLNDFEILFVGADEGFIFNLASENDVAPYVRVLPRIKREEVLKIQQQAHVLLFLEKEQEGVDGIMTGKLYEYLFSGTEIWGIGITEKCAPGRLIRQSGCGRLFGTDTGLIHKQLVRLLTDQRGSTISPDMTVLNKLTRKFQAEEMMSILSENFSQRFF